jgi:hypothetical protein
MDLLLIVQYLTLTLFVLNATAGLACALARGTTRAFARQSVESFMCLFVLAGTLHSFGLM